MDTTRIPFSSVSLKVISFAWIRSSWLAIRWPPFSGHGVGCNTSWSLQMHSLLFLILKRTVRIYPHRTLKAVTWTPGTYSGFCALWAWFLSFYFDIWASSYLSNMFCCFHCNFGPAFLSAWTSELAYNGGNWQCPAIVSSAVFYAELAQEKLRW